MKQPTIYPRSKNFAFSSTKKYWLNDCAVKTLFVNALSFYTPESERFFIRTVKPFYKQISDPHLKENVRHFIRQESNHQHEYIKYIQALIKLHYPNLSAKNHSQSLLAFCYALGGKKFGLALTVIGEHFAAVLSDVILKNVQVLDGAEQNMRHLLIWHCIEEIEHKAVVFDILKSFKGQYFYRFFAFFVISFSMTYSYFRVFWQMMRQDGLHKKWTFYKDIFYFCWGKPGIFRKMIKPYFAILLPWFHPWQQDNRALIKVWDSDVSTTFE